MPAVFSIRIRSPPIGARFDACFTDSTIVEIACPVVASRPRVHDQKIRSQRYRAHDLIVKCLDRPRLQHPLFRRQVD
jgi:hypothetical protein